MGLLQTHTYAWLLLTCLASWLVVRLGKAIKSRLLARRWRARVARSPDPVYDPLGIQCLRVLRRARKEHRLLVQWGQDMEDVGRNPHTVRRRILFHTPIVTRDLENIKAVLSTQFSNFAFDTARSDILSQVIGRNVITTEGEEWKHSRSLIRPQFTRESVYNIPLLERHAEELISKLDFGHDRWTGDVDLQPLFFNLTLDVSTEFLFGQSVHSQNSRAQAELIEAGGVSTAGFRDALDDSVNKAFSMSVLRQLGSWLLPYLGDFKRNRDQIRGVAEWYVKRALAESVEEKQAKRPEATRLVLLDELIKSTHDQSFLMNESLGLLLAARTTTALLIGWLFYFLARHPEVYQELRGIILREFGASPGSGTITGANLRGCRYLQHCLNETIRLAAPIPQIVRKSTIDTTLPRGGGDSGEDPLFVAKGTTVLLNLFGLHHREDLWGADVEEFRPERWEQRERAGDIVGFGGGPRVCIGQQFALTEASYTAVRLIQHCDIIEPVGRIGPARIKTAFGNHNVDGVHVRMHKYEDA
ncbi:MAG: hypothetical protein Q9219_006594 [cf. Caloplaca sp. 3 TL-2023]